MKQGPRNLITDVPGLRVGNAEDHEIKTGVTVLIGDRPFTAAVHIMGGAPGTPPTSNPYTAPGGPFSTSPTPPGSSSGTSAGGPASSATTGSADDLD